VNFYN